LTAISASASASFNCNGKLLVQIFVEPGPNRCCFQIVCTT
jgi:hypothetical protein